VFGRIAALSGTDIAQIVGAAAGVVAVVAAFLVYRWQRERKHLDYEFISGTRLFSQRAKELKRLELRYEENVISDPYLMLVRFINTGNKPITSDDFEWPVHIEAKGLEQHPLSAGVSETSHPDLRVKDRGISPLSIIEIPHPVSIRMADYWMMVGSTSWAMRSATATGSSQCGQAPPRPTRWQNTPQSPQRCSPR